MKNEANMLRQKLKQEVYAHARQNLFDYLQLIFPEAVPSGTFIEAKHTKLLARVAQQVGLGEIRRQLIAVPPRFGKSLVASVALPTWLLGHNPSLKIICASYGEELSRDFALQSRAITMSPIYRSMFPNTRLTGSGSAWNRLETTAGGYRCATSVDGAITGKGADIIIIDDPLKAKDAVYSQAMRDEAYNWITGTLMSRFDKPGEGRIIVLSQRLHTDDLVARLRDDGGWEMLSVPAEAQKPMTFDIGEKELWSLQAGDLIYPERFDHAALAQLKADLGEANYAAQILQDPQALGGAIFKVKDLQIMDAASIPLGKIEAIYQSWDTAISETETAAWSVGTTWGIYGKYFVLIDVFRERLSYPNLLKAVRAQYDKYKPRAVVVEKASSGTALVQQLHAEVLSS